MNTLQPSPNTQMWFGGQHRNLRLMIFHEKPWNCIQAVLFLSRIVYESDGYGWPIEHLKGNILQLSCGRV